MLQDKLVLDWLPWGTQQDRDDSKEVSSSEIFKRNIC